MDSKEELLKLFNKQLIDKCKKLKITFAGKNKNKLVDAILNHNKKQTKIKNTDTSDNNISDNDTNENSNKIKETKTESKEIETNQNELKKIIEYLEKYLTPDKLQEISNMCIAVNNSCTGDGSGLSSGTLIEKVVSAFFKNILPEFECYNIGQADMKICGNPVSFKKTTGKSELASNWTKPKKLKPNEIITNKSNEKYIKIPFQEHILIINLKTDKWWKRKPGVEVRNNLKFPPYDIIPMGIYIVDKEYCKKNVVLSSNTKTDTLIKNYYVYNMIQNSILNKLYIKLPEPNKKIKFDILKAFSE